MKRTKLWIMLSAAFIVASGILVVPVNQGFELVPVESQQRQPLTEPPENATVIEMESISFNLVLETRELVLQKGQSLNLTVFISSTENANLTLTVGVEDNVPPEAPNQPELPVGIIAYFDQTEVSVEAGVEITVDLILSIENQAISDTYNLLISAVKKTSHGSVSVAVPLQLTVP